MPGYKVRDMVREVDIDENGTVEFGEFVKVSSIWDECYVPFLNLCIINFDTWD